MFPDVASQRRNITRMSPSEVLNLSEEQRQYFTGVLPGQGLMKIGSAFVPFDGRIPSGGDLYRLYSTSFQEQEGK